MGDLTVAQIAERLASTEAEREALLREYMERLRGDEDDPVDPVDWLVSHWDEEVDSLDLLVRTRKCLRGAGIKTIRDLYHYEYRLANIPNFGEKSFVDLSDALACAGLPAINWRIPPAKQREMYAWKIASKEKRGDA